MKCIPRPLLLFQEGVEVRVARIFNTFGPRMHMNDGRVVSNFILQALQGEPLTVCASLEGGVGGGQKELAVCQQVTKEQCLLAWGVTFLRLPLCLGYILLPLVTRRGGAGGRIQQRSDRALVALPSAWAATGTLGRVCPHQPASLSRHSPAPRAVARAMCTLGAPQVAEK